MLAPAHQAPRWPYLEGRRYIKQVLKGQRAASRKAGGAEILYQLEVVQAVRHRHGVLEADLCRDRMPGLREEEGALGEGGLGSQQTRRTSYRPGTRHPSQGGHCDRLLPRSLHLLLPLPRPLTNPPSTQLKKLLWIAWHPPGHLTSKMFWMNSLSFSTSNVNHLRSVWFLLDPCSLKWGLAHSSHSRNICYRNES